LIVIFAGISVADLSKALRRDAKESKASDSDNFRFICKPYKHAYTYELEVLE
jgi:hypothetical protein